MWLRVAKNIGQNGRPVALFGTAVPSQFESYPERRYFTAIHYLALICDDAVLADRLQGRPAWRGSGRPGRIEQMVAFNRWIREHGAQTEPPMSLLDTTDLTVDESIEHTASWIEARLVSGG